MSVVTRKQRVRAETAQWRADLELDPSSGRILHCAHGSEGAYRLLGNLLVVEWDRWPAEVFWNTGGAYRMVFNTGTASSSNGLNAVDLNRVVFGRAGGVSLPVASVCVHLPHGDKLHLRPGTSDIPVFSAIFLSGDYEIRDETGDVGTVIDLGANIGASTVYFARRYPNAKIYAVEPEPSNARLLEMNVRDLPNVVSINAAIWSHDTECELDVEEDGVGRDHWAFRSREVGKGGRRIPALSMATLMRRYDIESVDILKVDIEGAEYEVFSADAAHWLANVRYLVVETHERFRTGSDAAVTRAVDATHAELAPLGENRVFARRDLLARLASVRGETAVID